MARSLSLILFVLLVFFIEHFFGLGRLNAALPVLMGISAWLFWKNRELVRSREFIVSETVFIAAFMYAFVWRFSFPSITPSSERLTDLFFITNYLQGVTLPPVDNWNPPHLFDYYYAFQHYAAALMGRIFNMSPGESYNYAFALLGALPITLVVFVGQRVFQQLEMPRYKRIGLTLLLALSILFGGNGFSPVLGVVYKAPEYGSFVKPGTSGGTEKRAIERYHSALANQSRDLIIGAARYIGSDRDTSLRGNASVNQSVGKLLLPDTPKPAKGKKLVLPSENLGYQYFLGDYHPTLGGFFLLTLGLGLIFSMRFTGAAAKGEEPWGKLSQAALTLCVPVMMITNTWTLPLLVVLISVWVLYRVWFRQPVYWLWLIGGGVVGTFLIYPFMTGFLTSTLSTPVAWVSADMRTPFSRFLVLQWPVLLLIAFGLWEGRKRPLAWFFSGLWLLLLIVSELIYIDDPTAEHFSRTNSVMKWWGWIQVGAFVSLGGLLMGSTIKWVRWASVAVLLVVTFSAGFELQRYWRHSGKYNAGHLEGHYWYTNNATNRQMFEYLEAAPAGIVLEPILDNAYSNTSMYGIFSGKPVLLGWPSHLRTWHGSVPRIWVLKDEIDQFYKAEKVDTLPWLNSNNVRYIVFGPKSDNKKFEAIHNKIKSEYAWHEYEHSRRRHTGIWVKVSP
ncbi:DUF2298 domain-containing protein [Teredinibacter haidensis]|uniref:DUF2298 domain-containing protein n=1 Tax=Teredinibacter haidensis TaxID=2731755 RepID=UPI001FE81D4A|nr:DUF2298 domain-containing protein [Teredinibacter haidensis]